MSIFPVPVDYNKSTYKQHLHLLSLLKEVRDEADCICPPFPKGASLLEMLGERCTITPRGLCCSSRPRNTYRYSPFSAGGRRQPCSTRRDALLCSDTPRGRTIKYSARSKSMAGQWALVPCLTDHSDPSKAESTMFAELIFNIVLCKSCSPLTQTTSDLQLSKDHRFTGSERRKRRITALEMDLWLSPSCTMLGQLN